MDILHNEGTKLQMYFWLKTLPHSKRAQCEKGLCSKPDSRAHLDIQIQICCVLSSVKKGLLMYNRLKTCSAMNGKNLYFLFIL